MRPWKLALRVVVAAVTFGSAGCGLKRHDIPLPRIAASTDQELVARGAYLFHGPGACTSCHVPRETSSALRGGEHVAPIGGFTWRMGPVGTMRAPNLTSDVETGIASRTDAELARAIRHGVLPDGTLSMLMTQMVGRFADDDVTALISYLRSLEPKAHAVEPSQVGVLGPMVFGSLEPKAAGPATAPPLSATIERGKYLADGAANCIGCHSVLEGTGAVREGAAYAGGDKPMRSIVEGDDNAYMAPNLTPAPATGIAGTWSEEQFVARFRAGRLQPGSPMPWGNFQNLHDDDVKALWMYLRTLPTIERDTGASVRSK